MLLFGISSTSASHDSVDLKVAARERLFPDMDEGELQQRVGAFLRSYRMARGLSQEAFAEFVGVHRTYMGSIERGEENLTLRSVERLAAVLDLDPLDMLSKAGPRIQIVGLTESRPFERWDSRPSIQPLRTRGRRDRIGTPITSLAATGGRLPTGAGCVEWE